MNRLLSVVALITLLPVQFNFGIATTLPEPLAVGYPSSYYAISDKGTLYAWGSNEYGQVGANDASSDNPQELLQDAVYVTAGSWCVLAIDEQKTLWGMGSTLYGIVPSEGDTVGQNGMVPILNDVSMASIGGKHAIALKSDGTVWVWGLDTSDPGGSIKRPPTQVVDNAQFVCAYKDWCLVVSTEGTLSVWRGADRFAPSADFTYQTLINSGVTSVSYSRDEIFILMESGELKAMVQSGAGFGEPVAIADNVAQCGSGYYITDGGELFAWDISADNSYINNTVQPAWLIEDAVCAVQDQNSIYVLSKDGAVQSIETSALEKNPGNTLAPAPSPPPSNSPGITPLPLDGLPSSQVLILVCAIASLGLTILFILLRKK